MKNIFLVSLIILALGISQMEAQVIRGQKDRIENLPNFDKQTLRFGFYLGMNNNNYKISYLDKKDWASSGPIKDLEDTFVSVDASLGFNLGFVIDYRLHQNVSLRFEPGLMSNTKTLTYFIDKEFYMDVKDPNGIPAYPGIDKNSDIREISSTYLHLPLLLKLSTNRYKNVRPYIIGGASYDYNFSNHETDDDNYENEFRMKSSNFMYEMGIGMDFYFSYFKFSPSIRGIFAINNEIVRDDVHHTYKPPGDNGIWKYPSPWTGPIDYFGTRGIYLNLTFQ